MHSLQSGQEKESTQCQSHQHQHRDGLASNDNASDYRSRSAPSRHDEENESSHRHGNTPKMRKFLKDLKLPEYSDGYQWQSRLKVEKRQEDSAKMICSSEGAECVRARRDLGGGDDRVGSLMKTRKMGGDDGKASSLTATQMECQGKGGKVWKEGSKSIEGGSRLRGHQQVKGDRIERDRHVVSKEKEGARGNRSAGFCGDKCADKGSPKRVRCRSEEGVESGGGKGSQRICSDHLAEGHRGKIKTEDADERGEGRKEQGDGRACSDQRGEGGCNNNKARAFCEVLASGTNVSNFVSTESVRQGFGTVDSTGQLHSYATVLAKNLSVSSSDNNWMSS